MFGGVTVRERNANKQRERLTPQRNHEQPDRMASNKKPEDEQKKNNDRVRTYGYLFVGGMLRSSWKRHWYFEHETGSDALASSRGIFGSDWSTSSFPPAIQFVAPTTSVRNKKSPNLETTCFPVVFLKDCYSHQNNFHLLDRMIQLFQSNTTKNEKKRGKRKIRTHGDVVIWPKFIDFVLLRRGGYAWQRFLGLNRKSINYLDTRFA